MQGDCEEGRIRECEYGVFEEGNSSDVSEPQSIETSRFNREHDIQSSAVQFSGSLNNQASTGWSHSPQAIFSIIY